MLKLSAVVDYRSQGKSLQGEEEFDLTVQPPPYIAREIVRHRRPFMAYSAFVEHQLSGIYLEVYLDEISKWIKDKKGKVKWSIV